MRKINKGQATHFKIQNKDHKMDIITIAYNKKLLFSFLLTPIKGKKGKGAEEKFKGE